MLKKTNPKKYKPISEMLSLIDAKKMKNSKQKIIWGVFKGFSRIPLNKTIFLWGKHHPLKKVKGQWFNSAKGILLHPLIDLMLANKIYAERNKTMKQIALEVSELLSEKLDKSVVISPDAVSLLNKFLNLRKSDELIRKGSHGGAKKRLSREEKKAIAFDLNSTNLSITEIAVKHMVGYDLVYRMAPEFRNTKTNPKKSTYYIRPEEKNEKIKSLIRQGFTSTQIVKKENVSANTIQDIRRELGIWKHSKLNSRKAELGNLLYYNDGRHTVKEIAVKTGYSVSQVYNTLRQMTAQGVNIVFKKDLGKKK